MKKKILFCFILILIFSSFESTLLTFAHEHGDKCYPGEKHYHTNLCKKIATTFAEYPFPKADCRTCGGDGFVESDCGGALTYAVIANDVDHNYVHFLMNGEVEKGVVGGSSFDMLVDEVCNIYCTGCGTSLFVGAQAELSSSPIHPFYAQIGSLLTLESPNWYGYLACYEPHTFNRCPDCMGETFVCTKCHGQWMATSLATSPSIYPCPGVYVRGEVKLVASHSIYYGSYPGPNAPSTCYSSMLVDAEACPYCGDLWYAQYQGQKANLNMTCSSHGYPGSSGPISMSPNSITVNGKTFSSYNSISMRGNSMGRAGRACSGEKHTQCQHCYSGAQTNITICGKDIYKYYDTNGNVVSDVCNKVVTEVAPVKT